MDGLTKDTSVNLDYDEPKNTESVPIVPLNVDTLNREEVAELNTPLAQYDSQPVFPGMNNNNTNNDAIETPVSGLAVLDQDNINKVSTSETTGPSVSTNINIAYNNDEPPKETTSDKPTDTTSHAQSVWDVDTSLNYANFDQISDELAELDSSLLSITVQKKTNSLIKGDNEDIELPIGSVDTQISDSMKGDNELPTLNEIMKGNNISNYVENLFKKKAENNGSYIPVGKLSAHLIKLHQPSKRSPPIDSYSSLEDIGDSDIPPIEKDDSMDVAIIENSDSLQQQTIMGKQLM